MSGKCIIICAPSGAGKTTITKFLLQQNLNLAFSISACNRDKRANEKDGVDYYFLTTETFKQKIKNNEFIEWEEVYKNQYYGTLTTEIERIWGNGKNVIFDVDVKGALNLIKYFKAKALAIFIKPPSLTVLEERLRKRGTETEDKIQKRLAKSAIELSYADNFKNVIVNKDLEKSKQKALKITKDFLDNI